MENLISTVWALLCTPGFWMIGIIVAAIFIIKGLSR